MKNCESSLEKLVLELKNLGHVDMSPQLLERLKAIPSNNKNRIHKEVLTWSLRAAFVGVLMLTYSYFIANAVESYEIQQLYSQYFNHLSSLI